MKKNERNWSKPREENKEGIGLITAAIINNIKSIATRNKKHFIKIKEIKIIEPY